MSELEFAFFNLMENDKRGLVYQKYLLDRLAPFFFAPRVTRLIDLPVINARGYHVVMPLGQGNLDKMEPERQTQMLFKSIEVTRDFNLPALAVDRRLKSRFALSEAALQVVFGDHFIKALAAAYIKRSLSRHDIKRIVVATDNEDLIDFMEYASQFDVPVSLQSYQPARYEPAAYQMMYQNGRIVSTSMFNPQSWSKGDLVVVFDPQDRFTAISPRDVFCLQLGNSSRNLAPLLERSLESDGVEAELHNLAPIMELCLGTHCQRQDGGAPPHDCRNVQPAAFISLEESARLLGLWDLFLDKAK
jgi:hypothetical protein